MRRSTAPRTVDHQRRLTTSGSLHARLTRFHASIASLQHPAELSRGAWTQNFRYTRRDALETQPSTTAELREAGGWPDNAALTRGAGGLSSVRPLPAVSHAPAWRR
jgi:hypothetical protein